MIFIDTGALIGRYCKKDQFHEQARNHWRDIVSNREQCVTSNFVLDETFTLLARWTDYAFAAETAKRIYQSQGFDILRPDLRDEQEAIRYFEKYADQKVSFTDCISFALMKQKGIRRVFSFDRHFESAGFVLYS